MRSILAGLAASLLVAGAASAQTAAPSTAPGMGTGPAATGTVAPTQNNTGGNPAGVAAPGPTGASTVTGNSAAGGNAGQPSRAVPQGSAGSGSR
ncbi:hypothetical protein DA075_02035 [Methylobacterium currus]|uniref:Proteophosphoglycan ppg4 n=1 Tax=Methylobacterium currus TaxID=2051553 RepID=A0A2R4WED1_9HYPH|nr:hypothetical protein [Methylobacterium currus]AWB19869.1 hypothetical protein DA075_02035 [Methylobacterium currus]UHC15412.1 hypothetical protein LRS73_23345 [Methylobacterium currus]